MTGIPDDASGPSEEAVAWFVRLQSDAVQASDWDVFEAWLTTDAENRSAFEAVERLWVDLGSAPIAAMQETASGQVLPFSKRSKRLSWSVWASVGGVAAALVVGFVALYPLSPSQGAPVQTIATAKGDRKAVTLADGTRIELNSASRLTYRLGKDGRWAQLMHGEAIFNVTHNPNRPFTVVTGDRRVTDVGTVFDVARLDHAVRVTVQQGAVAVSAAPPRYTPLTTVTAGQQLIHPDGAAASTVKAVDTDAAFAWRSGRLVYSDAPLDAVVEDLNQYFAVPIRVKDHKAGQLRFSGVLVLDSEGAVVDRLQAFMPVAAVRSNGVIWISARR